MFVIRRTDTGEFLTMHTKAYHKTEVMWTPDVGKARMYKLKNHVSSSIDQYPRLRGIPLERVRIQWSLTNDCEPISVNLYGYR